jgi:hypothetical protein
VGLGCCATGSPREFRFFLVFVLVLVSVLVFILLVLVLILALVVSQFIDLVNIGMMGCQLTSCKVGLIPLTISTVSELLMLVMAFPQLF